MTCLFISIWEHWNITRSFGATSIFFLVFVVFEMITFCCETTGLIGLIFCGNIYDGLPHPKWIIMQSFCCFLIFNEFLKFWLSFWCSNHIPCWTWECGFVNQQPSFVLIGLLWKTCVITCDIWQWKRFDLIVLHLLHALVHTWVAIMLQLWKHMLTMFINIITISNQPGMLFLSHCMNKQFDHIM